MQRFPDLRGRVRGEAGDCESREKRETVKTNVERKPRSAGTGIPAVPVPGDRRPPVAGGNRVALPEVNACRRGGAAVRERRRFCFHDPEARGNRLSPPKG